jgi:muramoyltetrapeptide carboxypeptidase LdcA involved in peptidoglycan recycling
MEPWHESLKDAMEVLTGAKKELQGYKLWEKESIKDEKQPLLPYHVTETSVLHNFVPEVCHNAEKGSCEQSANVLREVTKQKVTMEGRLLGGCMDCLVNLLGTKYDYVKQFNERYKEDGVIWFLESCDLNVMGIRRAMWQMEHAGWFQNVKGFLIGRPLCHGQEMMGLDQYKAVCDIIAGHGVPVIMDADLGHLPPMMPIVCGSKAKITVSVDNELCLAMEYV